MKILIASVGNVRTNEIKVLAKELNKNHNVTIACMATESPASGLAFSFQDAPIRVSPLLYKDIIKNSSWVATKDVKSLGGLSKSKVSEYDGIAAYEFFSNPADAISIMLSTIMAHDLPDLVICGINNGIHMGQDIYSSSSVNMAMEAAFFRVPAVAVATDWQAGGHSEAQLESVVQFIAKNVETFANLELPPLTFLNINVPCVEKYKMLKGVKISRAGRLTQLNEYEEKVDVKGNKYYWAKRVNRLGALGEPEWAKAWFERNYVTIVPLCYDATDYDAIKEWQKVVGVHE